MHIKQDCRKWPCTLFLEQLSCFSGIWYSTATQISMTVIAIDFSTCLHKMQILNQLPNFGFNARYLTIVIVHACILTIEHRWREVQRWSGLVLCAKASLVQSNGLNVNLNLQSIQLASICTNALLAMQADWVYYIIWLMWAWVCVFFPLS
jgi:hypothetical protein